MHNGQTPMLTQDQVNEARILYRTGAYTIQKLATRYGVSKKTLYYYLNNPHKKGR